MKTVKFFAGGAAALAIIGGAAAGITSVVAPESASVRLIAVGAPVPQDPPQAVNVPTADQLTGLLTSLADPSVPFANKSNLVEGGISGLEAHVADKKLQKAAKNGDLPLAFNVTNVQPAAAGSATADVAVSGPKLTSPVTQNVTFVNQGGWVLSRSSAMELLQAAGQ
ncbi:hypothetical protein AWB91_02140 [Mycobacterium paraense]|jgi:hypothetical protein|uniref:Low molecular weight antigen MTB12-like C-terminal domain-containing protein n=1 Tax=Mycobacterium paraense TaxID=767916 RepID=A0A1X2AIX6_9MYCO|nr:hypothetical protein [Mycobacterium paraense]MCV7444118.1 hypothetical protein [Mycobacterium paraense]ORW28841.1 hypothetical protein AWB91_02140 [Mycobacterium paraense]ORW35841.1 hypothetical protein AWB88_02140 [Mycobacterium paraense]ORW47827.1 hypothetical protein AWB89_08580 [Mycobacterium paraense]ORW51328.1 hypothetical protein AWB90_05235 [Mycobacterium paraense]